MATKSPANQPGKQSGNPAARQSTKEKQRLRAERAAAALREKQRRERRRQVLTVVGVVVAVAVIIVGGFLINSMRDDTTKTKSASELPPPGSSFGLTIGPPTAPHQVVIYEDFLCPFCGEFEKTSHEQLAQLAADGKVQIEYRPFVFLTQGDYSERADLIFTIVKQKYGDDVAKKFHDLLYQNQPEETGPFPSRDDLYALAVKADPSVNVDDLKKAVDDQDGVQDVVDATKSATDDVGIHGTPSIFLDGKAYTNGRTVDDLATNLIQALQ